MFKRKALALSVLSLSLAGPALTGCKFQASVNAGDEGKKKKAEPPPQPPAPPAPAPAAAPAQPPQQAEEKITQKGSVLRVPGNIVFEHGKATLMPGAGSEETLAKLKTYLVENPRVTLVRIEGHTDNVGQPADNLELSGQRALTVKKWLTDNGIKKERLIAVGFGETQPLAPNTDDDGRGKNRRTEFKIVGVDSKPYAGMKPAGDGKVFDL